jgi:hypothetical protein
MNKRLILMVEQYNLLPEFLLEALEDRIHDGHLIARKGATAVASCVKI